LPDTDYILVELIQEEVRHSHLRFTDFLLLCGMRRIWNSNERSLLLYLFIHRVI